MKASRRLLRYLWLLPALIVLTLIAGAGVVVLRGAYDGVSWDPTGRVMGLNAGGPADRAGLRIGDVVLFADGCSPTWWNNCEQWFYRPHEMILITFRREDRLYTTTLTTTSPPAMGRVGELPGLLVALVACLFSIIVLLNHPDTTETRLFYAMGQIGAAALVALTLSGRLIIASRGYNVLFCLLSPVLVHFHAVFPQQRCLARKRWLLAALYLAGLALGAVWPIKPVHNLWMLLGFVAAIGLMLGDYVTSTSSYDRQRIRLIVFGTLLGFGPIALLTVAPAAFFGVQWLRLRFTIPPLILIPITYAIALWRYNLMGFDRTLNRGLVYLLISAVFFGLYFAALTLFHTLLPAHLVGRAALGAAIALLAAVTFRPLRDRVQRAVDRLFYGGWYDYRGLVEEVGQALAYALDPEALAKVLVHRVPQAMHLPGAALWLEQEGKMELVGTWGVEIPRLQAWGGGNEAAGPREVRMSQSQAIMPLVAEDRTLGVWVLSRRLDDEWGSEDRHILTVLGRQAALAAHNVRLVATLRSKVAEVEEMHRRLLVAREEERAELARELHDGVIQDLIGLRYRLEALQEVGDETGQVEHLHGQVGVLVDELRHLCAHLRPTALDQLGLAAALRALAREVTARGLPVEVYLEDVALPDGSAIGLYRISQEALNNAWRHAAASQAVVTLVREGDGLVLTVADDGHGFDPASTWGREGSLGLLGMSERAQAIGGHLALESAPGEGTRVTVRLGTGTTVNV